MIERLTPEQVSQLAVYRRSWIQIGLSCEPLNLDRAKQAVNSAYRAAGLDPPRIYLVADSPVSGAMMAAILKSKGDQVRDQVRAQVWDQVRDQVWDQVWDQVRDQVWAQVGDQVWAQVRDQVYGAHDAGWLSFYAFMREQLSLECVAPMEGLLDLAKHCGWWAPYKGAVILQHRHSELHLDDQGRLHNEMGPAVLYRDGFAVYAVHGVRVPATVITSPGDQTIKEISGEQNAEIRRVRIERFGTERYLRDAGAKAVDVDSHEHNGNRAIWQVGESKYLNVCDPSTGKTFWMDVPPDVMTCEQADNYLTNGLQGRLLGRS